MSSSKDLQYQSLLHDSASFNHKLNLIWKILQSRNKAKFAVPPSFFVKPTEPQSLRSPKPSNSKSLATANHKVLHLANRPVKRHKRNPNTLSASVSAADLKEDQGNTHLTRSPHNVTSNDSSSTITSGRGNPSNPFSDVIRSSEDLLVDLTSLGLVEHVLLGAEQCLINLAIQGLAPVCLSRIDQVLHDAEQLLAGLALKGLAPAPLSHTPPAM